MEAKQAQQMLPAGLAVAPAGTGGKMDKKWQEFCWKVSPENGELMRDIVGKNGRRKSTVGVSLQAYADQHADEVAKCKELANSPNWTFKKNQDDVDIFTMLMPGDTFASYKGVTKMRVPPGKGIQHVFLCLLQVQDRPKWDDMCIMGEMLECHFPFYRASYYQMKTPFRILSDRDICLIVRPNFEEDGSIITVSEHYETDAKPNCPPFVRCKVIRNAYIIQPTADPDEFWVTVTGSVDPCGWMPAFIKNLVMWKQALTLAKLRNYVAKDEIGK